MSGVEVRKDLQLTIRSSVLILTEFIWIFICLVVLFSVIGVILVSIKDSLSVRTVALIIAVVVLLSVINVISKRIPELLNQLKQGNKL